MKTILLLSLLLLAQGSKALPTQQPLATPTGIPLDAPWKKNIFDFAVKNVVHPSWGLAHSERDYQSTLALARNQNIDIDLDVLFASSFLHDLGGNDSYKKQGVDHAIRSVELAGPLLQSSGFPMQKFTQVKEMILGHVYYGPAPQSKSALLFRDADILDFLGTIGVARILAITEEPDRHMTLPSAIQLIGKFTTELPPKLSSPAAQREATKRVAQMRAFLRSLGPYTFGGKAL